LNIGHVISAILTAILAIFISFSRRMSKKHLEIGHCHLLPKPYLLTFHPIRCFIISATETVSLNNLRITKVKRNIHLYYLYRQM